MTFSSRIVTEISFTILPRIAMAHIYGPNEPRIGRALLLTLLLMTILQCCVARQHCPEVTVTAMPWNYTNSSRINDNSAENASLASNGTGTRPINSYQMVGYIVVPTILALGLVGNTMTFFVMRYSLFSVTSVSLVVAAISLSDVILILLAPFNKQFIQQYIRFDVRALHWLGCKAFFWLWRTAKMTSSWFVVLIALERLVVAIRPPGAQSLFTKRYASVGIMFVCLLSIAYNTGLASIADVIKRDKCVYGLPENPSFGTLIRSLSLGALCLYTFIPIVFALFLCILSVCLVRRQEDPERLPIPDDNEESEKNVSEKLSSMLFGVVIIFCNLMIPAAVLHIMPMALPGATSSMPFAIFRIVAETMEELNYSIKFYVYLICSCFFREQLGDVFGCSCKATNSQEITVAPANDESKQNNKAILKRSFGEKKRSPEEGTSTKTLELCEKEDAIPEDAEVDDS